MGRLLDDAENEDLDDEQAAVVREIRRDHERAAKVPGDLVETLTRLQSEAQDDWREAKSNDDFSAFEPVYDVLLADAEGRDGLGTARGVAERIDSSRVTAHCKLESLASAGYVRKTKVAGRAVWTPTDDTPTFDDETEQDEHDVNSGESWKDDRLNGGDSE